MEAYPQDYGYQTFDPVYCQPPPPRPIEQYVPGYPAFHHNQQPPSFDHATYHFRQRVPCHPVPPPTPGYEVQQSLPQHQAEGNGTVPFHMIHHDAQAHGFGTAPVDYSSQPVQLGPPQSQLPLQVNQPVLPPAPPHQQMWQPIPLTTEYGPQHASPSSSHSSRTLQWNHAPASENVSPSWPTNGYVPRPELSLPIDYQPPHHATQSQSLQYQEQSPTAPPQHFQDHTTPEFYEHEIHAEPTHSPTHILTQAAVETQDDDYYDVQSDEEMEVDSFTLAPFDQGRHRALQNILEANDINIRDPHTRRYDTFIHGGVLAHYKPEEAANPLRNSYTGRVFAHFISVTGPSLSIYERQFRNTSLLFSEGRVPFSQQGLWTYTMPLAAMRHQGLLHSMLALASLHIARLTGASPTPSMQHYAWAIKRIHNCVGDEKKRFKLTTIAATMLLGFYEIMTADHMKWNAHLAGSKQLFVDTDFSTMSKQFRRLKIEREERRRQSKRRQSTSSRIREQDGILDQIHDVDERMISELAGREVRYDSHGQIMTPKNTIPAPLDLSKFEILKDLYWWYLKQDVYQSIVSGNPLL